MTEGWHLVRWGWRGIWKRPAWIARNVALPGGKRLVFEIGIGPISVARVAGKRASDA